MHFLQRHSVRAFLPVVGLVVAHASGGAGEMGATRGASGAAGNRAPTLAAITVASTHSGTSYQLTPRASDPDGDALTFSAVNLPPWARIDRATGVIVGTPGVSDIGAYESITITVADATHQTTSAPFSITVQGPSAAHLVWRKPDMRVDGSTLDDLAGYRIVYGRDPEDLNHSIFIADPNQVSYDFDTLAKGAWYFAVIALTADGLEGPPTVPAMKMI